MSQPSPLETRFADALTAYGPDLPTPVTQYAFAVGPNPELGWLGGRRWRFDFAWPAARCAVEVDGIYSVKSRHRTASGYHEDCDKLNAAAQLGWRVLRYTSRHLATDEGSRAAVEQIRQIFSLSVQGGVPTVAKGMS